jgi:TonB family protein
MTNLFHPVRFFSVRRIFIFSGLALIVFCGLLFQGISHATPRPEHAPTALEIGAEAPGAHSSVVRSGTLVTRDGLTLRLTTDLGSVRVLQLEPGAAPVVRYTVHIETNMNGPAAQQLLENYVLKARPTNSGVELAGTLPPQSRPNDAQFWIQFEVTVPSGYNVDVNTEVGDIETQDIGGTASLRTQGGNIRTGRIGGSGLRDSAAGRSVAKLETQGGHIQVLDVAGDITAFTAGGHISVGSIAGDASLRTGGGHVRAVRIGGRADLETVGGNITVAHTGNFVNVRTGGGQIDFGEVRGSVHAQTGGGGIRVVTVSGPMEVQSSGGSICLTRVSDSLQAATSGGTITAWINPDAPSGGGNVRLSGSSQLTSGNGDIVVFLPRNLAANIDAIVATGGEHRIEADPALHLVIQGTANGNAPVHATATLNGGGAPLRLRSTTGKIRLQYLDSEVALRESLIREQIERISQRIPEYKSEVGSGIVDASPVTPPGDNLKLDWLDKWMLDWERKFWGGIRENPDVFQKRVLNAPKPSYPALAQRAGLQGVVKLQVRVLKDGRVEVLKLLEGDPTLADAAINAVKQWRAKPIWMNGEAIEVISTVTFNFQLH